MQYLTTRFPDRIAFGAESDPQWSTDVIVTVGGFEATNQNWTAARHVYDLSLAVRKASSYITVREHFHMARGRAKKFRFKDFLDFQATSQPLSLVSGSDYRMLRRYGSGSDSFDRRITRPVTGTVTVYRTRTGVTSAIIPTINYETGIVTVSGHVGGDTYTWTGEFDTPVRYDVDRLPGRAVNKEGSVHGELFVDTGPLTLIEVRDDE